MRQNVDFQVRPGIYHAAKSEIKLLYKLKFSLSSLHTVFHWQYLFVCRKSYHMKKSVKKVISRFKYININQADAR